MPTSEDIVRYTESRNPAPPARLGERYTADRFLPESGNTVVCHLDRRVASHRAVVEARRCMRALPDAGRFIFTPVSSLHMTVFEGALETHRRVGVWPATMTLDSDMATVTEHLKKRLAGFSSPPAFNVRIRSLLPTGLQLEGATRADEDVLRGLRDALCDPFGYRSPHHENYRFHMTFAYPVTWLPDALAPVWTEKLQEIEGGLKRALPVLPLTRPAFCTFSDMTHFEPRLEL